jgi:DNA-binding NarL/FixJ family response regulator
MEEKDTIAAAAHGQTAVRIGRALNDVDTTMMGEALRGLALVTEGKVAEGMRLLDHATTTATTGEATYLPAIGTTCCYLIHACQRVFDYDRAAQWCHRVKEFCRQWQSGSLFAICRTQYAMVLIARGRWGEAERELLSASSELSRYRPALVNACTVRLGELRRRQGRWEEALQLFEQVQSHILSFLGRGWIALDQDDAKTALEFAERYLRRVPAGDRTERVPGLELLFRSLLKLGKMELAETTASELQVTADLIPAKPLRAAASLARGLVSSARSELDNALREIEDGIDLFEDIAMPYDAALARKELALLFLRLDRITRVEMEAKKALQVFEQLGAAKEAERVAEIVRQIQHHGDSVPPATPARNEEGLTRREIEVLRRVAAGKRNAEIADELFVSIRTVEAHVTSIYRKLGVSGIRARAAIIQYARTQGISPST